ncbi:MAG: hypothetical protein IJA15_06795 [Clostridia bacterium]|nr:hypothetical protein [Clostridia bacterium]
MKLLAQLNPRPRGFGDGSYYRIRDLSTTLTNTRKKAKYNKLYKIIAKIGQGWYNLKVIYGVATAKMLMRAN